MKFFGFVTKLFSAEKEKVDVNLSDLNKWIYNKLSANITESKGDFSVKSEELKTLLVSARESLTILENAQLRNDNIDERLKNFMSGNRTNYIRQVSMFLDNLIIPSEFEGVKQFVSSSSESFSTLNKSASKSFYILQEFFSVESGKVAENLKKIADCINHMHSLVDSKETQFINEVSVMSASLQKELGKKKMLSDDIDALKKSIAETESSLLARQKDLDNLEGTVAFKGLQSLRNDIAQNEDKLKKIDFEITQMFSPLSRAFRKYEKIAKTNVEVISRYDDPLNGLLFDTQFRILEVLRGITIAILKKDIELKDGDKVMKRINEITREKLNMFSMSYFHVKQEIERLKMALKSNETQYAHNDILAMMKHLSGQLDRAKVELDNKSHDLSLIVVDRHLADLTEKINNHMDIKINIII